MCVRFGVWVTRHYGFGGDPFRLYSGWTFGFRRAVGTLYYSNNILLLYGVPIVGGGVGAARANRRKKNRGTEER